MGVKSAHQDPEWFREKMILRRGQEWLDKIVEMSRVDCMAPKQDYDEIKSCLDAFPGPHGSTGKR